MMPNVPDRRPIALIEPYAEIGAGHWSTALPQLAVAAIQDGRPCLVICLNGISPETRAAVRRAGASLVDKVPYHPRALVFVFLARSLRACYHGLRVFSPSAALALHQLSRALIEAASLQVARSRLADPRTAVILTSHETLPRFVSQLGGLSHLRFVHETDQREGRTVQAIERRFSRTGCRPRYLCGTGLLAKSLKTKDRDAQIRVVPFTTRDSSLYASDAERAAARRSLSVGGVVLSLVGSWWKSKDMNTILRALQRVNRPITVLVAGAGIDSTSLARHVYGKHIAIRVIDRVLDPRELASVYGASDCAVISRFPDGSESGTAYDAVQRGTALICSDHDPDLTKQLRGRPWARVFRAGDEDDLARVIERVCDDSISRPPPDAADVFGLVDARRQLVVFDEELVRNCG